MKSNYAIFDQSGTFLRLEPLDPELLPPVPLADDGLPRAVKMQNEPTVGKGMKLVPTRFGGWVEVEADPAPVPAVLPAWRILAVMDIHGYTATVEAIIDGLKGDAKKIAKRQLAGSNIERTHALVLAAQQALGLTDEQVDDLFREGDALV